MAVSFFASPSLPGRLIASVFRKKREIGGFLFVKSDFDLAYFAISVKIKLIL